MNVRVATKCKSALLKHSVKHVQLGSAIVVLVTMQNTNSISGITKEYGAHTDGVTDFDKDQLLSVI